MPRASVGLSFSNYSPDRAAPRVLVSRMAGWARQASRVCVQLVDGLVREAYRGRRRAALAEGERATAEIPLPGRDEDHPDLIRFSGGEKLAKYTFTGEILLGNFTGPQKYF